MFGLLLRPPNWDLARNPGTCPSHGATPVGAPSQLLTAPSSSNLFLHRVDGIVLRPPVCECPFGVTARFIQVIARGRRLFNSLCCTVPWCYVCRSFYAPSVVGHLDSFWLGALTSSAAVNVPEYFLVTGAPSISVGYLPRRGIPGS